MKIEDALRIARHRLLQNHIEEAGSKSKRILAHILDVSKEYLIINDKQELTHNKEKQYIKYIDKLIAGEPIQYLLGKQEFMGIEFKVNKNVLIPQPDTEVLVQKVIEISQNYNSPSILDLCTGSGAIAVALSEFIPNSKITGTDISSKALSVAKDNDNNKKIKFIKSDLFKNITKNFDIIVSNPPYIKTEEIKELSKEVQNEPLIALDGGKDGLEFYKKIISCASNYLKDNGALCLEIGETQKNDIIELINKTLNYHNINCYKDFSGNDRIIICYKKMQ